MSTASQMITTIDTAIASIVSKEAQQIVVDGETYDALDISKLYKLRASYEAIVGVENAAANNTVPFGITGLAAGNAR